MNSNQNYWLQNHGEQQFYLPNFIDIGEYVPPSLLKPDDRWEAPSDVDITYKIGSVSIRQHNNENIDDYYESFVEKASEYVAPTPYGRPTVLYQNLGEATNLDAALAPKKSAGTICFQSQYFICFSFNLHSNDR